MTDFSALPPLNIAAVPHASTAPPRSRPLMLDDVTRQRLRYVKVRGGPVRLDRFPDFLIAGPQRTGTTWLHAHLRFHPQIFLAEPKELFFFSRLKDPTDPRFRSNELEWYLQFFRDPPWRFALRTALALWNHRQLYRPRVRGEATATYAALDPDVIDEIVALNPEIKVVLMIRNPIERAWSHAKKDLVRNRGRKLAEVSEAEFEQFFASDYQRKCARYVENYDHWAPRLQPGNLFVGRFDDIAVTPTELLLEVMSFLGVGAHERYLDRRVREAVNPTGPSRIPERHRAFLETLLGPDIAALKQRFGLSWPRS
jgi:hypothetical protein